MVGTSRGRVHVGNLGHRGSHRKIAQKRNHESPKRRNRSSRRQRQGQRSGHGHPGVELIAEARGWSESSKNARRRRKRVLQSRKPVRQRIVSCCFFRGFSHTGFKTSTYESYHGKHGEILELTTATERFRRNSQRAYFADGFCCLELPQFGLE